MTDATRGGRRRPPHEQDDLPRPAAGQRRSALAVITMVVAVVFQPILHPTGPGNSSPVDLFIVAAVVLARSGWPGPTASYARPTSYPWPCSSLAGAASGLVSPLPTRHWSQWRSTSCCSRGASTVVNVLAGPRAMRYALVAWSWSGIVWAAVVIARLARSRRRARRREAAEGNRVRSRSATRTTPRAYWDSDDLRRLRRASRRAGGGCRFGRVRHIARGAGADGVQRRCPRARRRRLCSCWWRDYRRRGWVGVSAAGLR